ncbi:hypothetical protein ACG04R_16355 [Roseateles sp. BYS78W]|uniref:Uncharacterized protein n=1 Tax=Pelomonas candidula TaxID=3299025 RepID=A0ABW7HEL1_9BURK
MTDETEVPVLERKRPALDQALVASFRAEMEARKLKRALMKAQASEDDIVDGDVVVEEPVELKPIEAQNVEAPVGTGYDFDEPKVEAGGFIPTKEESYAYQKVLAIRLRVMGIPTIEPTDYTLEEFDRIEKYNLELVERKAGQAQK